MTKRDVELNEKDNHDQGGTRPRRELELNEKDEHNARGWGGTNCCKKNTNAQRRRRIKKGGQTKQKRMSKLKKTITTMKGMNRNKKELNAQG